VSLLRDDPLLLVFVVAAVGYLAGRIRIGGFGFGVAAVLFAGLAFGMADPQLKVPRSLWTLGLVLFVYTVGLAAGPGFLTALRRRGVGANVAVLVAVTTAAATIAATGLAVGIGPEATAGAYSGGLTNTPALAATLEALKTIEPKPSFDAASGRVLVGYSLGYPLGVTIALLAVFALARRRRRSDDPAGTRVEIVVRTALVEHPGLGTVGAMQERSEDAVTFGRIKRGEEIFVASDDVDLRQGDLVTVVGPAPAADAVVALLGRESTEHVELERGEVDFRRIVVSQRAVAGRTVADLELQSHHGGAVTRVRRGDVDMVAAPDLVLELGDRVRVVAPPSRMDEITRYFGDSYRELRELDVLSFSVGVALGLLVGAIDVPLPGGGTFSLGFAGGPLVVGLLLGAIGRTGPIVWQLPHSANLTLRQLGTVLFLAGIGVNAGDAFGDTILSRAALGVVAAAVVVAATASLATVLIGTLVLRLPPTAMTGIVSGMQTQPAVLAYASEQVEDDTEVNVAYATVVPLAMILKIVLAPLLLRLLS
jgi:putative transport protein